MPVKKAKHPCRKIRINAIDLLIFSKINESEKKLADLLFIADSKKIKKRLKQLKKAGYIKYSGGYNRIQLLKTV